MGKREALSKSVLQAVDLEYPVSPLMFPCTSQCNKMDLDQVLWLWQNKAVELNIANSRELVKIRLLVFPILQALPTISYTNVISYTKMSRFHFGQEKKKTLFYEADRPYFSTLGDFFFSLVCWNHVKSAFSGQSVRTFGWKFVKITTNIFPKFFSQNVRFFRKSYVFKAAIFATRKKKIFEKKKN